VVLYQYPVQFMSHCAGITPALGTIDLAPHTPDQLYVARARM
jgi:hypothetical protein